MKPLDDITVIALEHAIAAPLATRHLADLGARVIKIERPGSGDFARRYDERVRGLCSHFVWTNRSKESLTLDVKTARGREVLLRLLERADVFMQNLAPGAAERLGLTAAALRERHPRLIVCDISGYGPDGPYRDKKAYDLMIQAEAGLLSVTGTAGAPAKAGISVADIAAGMYAYSGILAALRLRDRAGEGSHVEVSMLEALAEWMGFPLYYASDGADPPPRSGAEHATIFPYGPFRTGDDEQVLLSVQNEREWACFCHDVLRRPELARDVRFAGNSLRNTHRDELRGIIEEVFMSLEPQAVVQRLDAAGIANARVNAMGEVWNHPQLSARHRWREVQSPVGALPALLPPAGNSAFDPRMDAIPALGEHTESILAELGYSRSEVEALRKAGVV
ncbi:MAG: CoA transferase [Proteobacteria bacterium]|nr:MAG: CoA transferase [Pseudomonadota bacterium]QKK11607.1 MAG: CoA transferase [Pseudomonadota bacterium]